MKTKLTTGIMSKFTEGNGFAEACSIRGHSVQDVLENPALMRKRPEGSRELVAFDSLPDNAWRQYDQTAVEEGMELLVATSTIDQMAVSNPMGTTELRIPKVDTQTTTNEGMNPDSQNDETRISYETDTIPIPWTWIDYEFPAQLPAAQGNYIAQTIRNGMRAVMTRLETMLFTGASGTYNGNTAPGLSHSDVSFSASSGGKWNAASGKDGDEYVADVVTAMASMAGDNVYGIPDCFVHPTVIPRLAANFSDNYSGSIRLRLLEILNSLNGTSGITTATTVYFVARGTGTVQWASAMAPSTFQWTTPSGFTRHVLVAAKAVPAIVPTYDDHVGAYRLT